MRKQSDSHRINILFFISCNNSIASCERLQRCVELQAAQFICCYLRTRRLILPSPPAETHIPGVTVHDPPLLLGLLKKSSALKYKAAGSVGVASITHLEENSSKFKN